MPANGYNTALWTFYLTFVLMEVPSNLLMNYSKVPPNYWLATSMVLLGIVTMCQGFVQSPAPLYVCRTIMGIFEGSLGPAAALMMGSYYRKMEFPVSHVIDTCLTLAETDCLALAEVLLLHYQCFDWCLF
jgi:MFS family permease